MKIAVATLAFMSLPATQVASAEYDPNGFNDCILEYVSVARSDFAADQLRRACARKHETDLNGQKEPWRDEPSVTEHSYGDHDVYAGVKWNQVVTSDDFLMADRDTRDLMRRKYLEWVIIPGIPESQKGALADEVRAKFMERTEPDIERNAFDAFDEQGSGPWDKY